MIVTYLYHEYYILPVTFIFYIFYEKWRNRKLKKKLSSFYTKSSLPFIGHVHHITGKMQACIEKVLHIMRTWRFPATAWIFHLPLVIVGTPKDVQTVLNTSHDRGLLKRFRESFAEGILVSDGEKWRKSRRLISSVLSTSMMQQYAVVFNQYSHLLVKKIEPFANTDTTFDIWTFVANMNVDVIFENMAEYKLQALQKEDHQFFQHLEESADLDSRRCTQPLLYFDFLYKIYLNITGKWKVHHTVMQLLREIIQAKLKDYELNQSHPTNNPDSDEKKRKTLLDVMVNVHNVDPTYTIEHFQDDFLDIMTAGSVTTTRGTSFTLLVLAMHPDIQEKAYQEILTTFGDSTEPVQTTDMNKLVYLDQCLKETLRMFTPVPLTFRKHLQEIALNEKQTIPANCDIVVSMYSVHHNHQQFPNPHIWDPDRFTTDAINNRDRYAFVPFGAGPHICLGSKYAMISMKTQLVYLLRGYRFTTDMKMDDIKLNMNAVLKLENGFWMKIWHRKMQNT